MPTAARAFLGILLSALLLPAVAQDKSTLRPVRVVLASNKLPVTADKPLQFRLLNVSIPAGKTATFSGGTGFIYVSGGKAEIQSGPDKSVLAEGAAKYLDGAQVTLRAPGPKALNLLHYLLAPANAAVEKPYSGAAAVSELFRGKDPAPLASGPHEFALTRVTSPVGAPAPPMHHRSGAALYRVLSGTATLHMQGKDEPRSAGAVQYEPNGFIHTWENTGKVPLVLLQANVSAEGTPEIIWLK